MPKIIDCFLPLKYFAKDKDNRLLARLAKYSVAKGDILRFWEIDDQGQKTSRFYDRVITDFHKIHKAVKYWPYKDLIKYGFYIFDVTKPTKLKKLIRSSSIK